MWRWAIFLIFLLLIPTFACAQFGGLGDLPPDKASKIRTDISVFEGNLGASDITVQQALDTFDEFSGSTLTEEEVEDYVGGMLGGTETRISVTYQDGTNDIDFVVDDMNDDVPDAGDFGNATDLDANGALNVNSVDDDAIDFGVNDNRVGLDDFMPTTDDTILLADGARWQSATMPDCNADNETLAYTQSTNTFSCGDDDSGAAATPGGSGTQVQFNNEGNFDGDPGFVYNYTTDTVTINGAIIVNESGADVDSRIESSGNANMVYIDAGNNWVGVGTNAPATVLEVAGAHETGIGMLLLDGTSHAYFTVDGTTNSNSGLFFKENGNNRFLLDNIGNGDYLRLYNYGTTSARMIVNYASGNIGIGTDTTPDYNLDVQGTLNSDGNFTVGTGSNITLGSTQWNSSDDIDATKVADADIGDIDTSSGVWTIEPEFISGKTDVTSTDSDYILIWDATDSVLKKVDMGEVRGGGSGTPGGSGTQVQFNNEGSFDGDPGFVYNYTTDTITVGVVDAATANKEVQITAIAYNTEVAIGDGKAYFHIGEILDGLDLTYVHAEVITAGTTHPTIVQIHNVTDAVDMLSTPVYIDSTETGSDTATTSDTIDTGNDDVAENDLLRIDVDGESETPSKGLIFTMGFD